MSPTSSPVHRHGASPARSGKGPRLQQHRSLQGCNRQTTSRRVKVWVASGQRVRTPVPDGHSIFTERTKAEDDCGRASCLERTKEKDFTLRGLVAELAERGLKVDYRTVWSFVHTEKLSFKKTVGLGSATVPTSHDGERSGPSTRTRSNLNVWFSSTRPGPRRIWRRDRAASRRQKNRR